MVSSGSRLSSTLGMIAGGLALVLPALAQEAPREVEREHRIERGEVHEREVRIQGPRGERHIEPGRQVIRQRIRERAGIGRGPMSGMIPPDIQREIGLTEEQRRKMQEIRFNSEKARIQGEATLQIHQMELQRLLEGDAPDRTAIDRKIQEISQDQAALMRARVTGDLDNRSVLTTEQRAKMRELMQRRAAPRPPMVDQPGPPSEPERMRPRQVPPSAPRP